MISISFNLILVIVAFLLLLSVTASKISDRFGIPALILFLLIGMLAGSDGPGGIYFDDPTLAQYVGIVALVIILFSGGLETNWKGVRPILKEGLTLATLGVLTTALIMAAVSHFIFNFTFFESMLLGAIISSTDAAAVFSILRSRGATLKGKLAPLLELESGSNDPMAVFLTVAMLQIITGENDSLVGLVGLIISQGAIGMGIGVLIGKAILYMLNRLRLGYEGLYPILVLAVIFFTYGFTAELGGSGFLAVYVVGLTMSQQDFLHKRSLIRFYDGVTWLMQITMFLTLGLLVFPSRMINAIEPGILVALALMFVARPASVFLCLAFSKFNLNEKAFLSWVGLRGAVPIILATYPLIARIPHADLFFNVVFFVVLLSVMLQGTTLAQVARLFKVDDPIPPKRVYPIELIPNQGVSGELVEVPILEGSPACGKAIFELHLPTDFLVILIARGETFLIPNGGTILQPGDVMLSLTGPEDLLTVRQFLASPVKPQV